MADQNTGNTDTIYTLIHQRSSSAHKTNGFSAYIAEISVDKGTGQANLIRAESSFDVKKYVTPPDLAKNYKSLTTAPALLTGLSGVTVPLSTPKDNRLYAVDGESAGLFAVNFTNGIAEGIHSAFGSDLTHLNSSGYLTSEPVLTQIKALAVAAKSPITNVCIALCGITKGGDLWICIQEPNSSPPNKIYQATLVKANASYRNTNITVDKDYICILQEGSKDKRVRFIRVKDLLSFGLISVAGGMQSLQTYIDGLKLPETYVTLPSDLSSIRLGIIEEVLYAVGTTRDKNIQLIVALLKDAKPGLKSIDYQTIICNTQICGTPLGVVGNDKIAAIAFQNLDSSAGTFTKRNSDDSYTSKVNRGNLFLLPRFEKSKLAKDSKGKNYYDNNGLAINNVGLTQVPYNIGMLNSNIYLGIKNEGKLGFARVTIPETSILDETLEPTYFFSQIPAEKVLDSIVVL